MARALGIDPARNLGWAVVESAAGGAHPIVVAHGTLPLGRTEGVADLRLCRQLLALMQEHKPDRVAIELVRRFASTAWAAVYWRCRTAASIAYAQHRTAHSVVWSPVPVELVKLRATGRSKASKVAIQTAALREFGLELTHDEADAVFVGLASML